MDEIHCGYATQFALSVRELCRSTYDNREYIVPFSVPLWCINRQSFHLIFKVWFGYWSSREIMRLMHIWWRKMKLKNGAQIRTPILDIISATSSRSQTAEGNTLEVILNETGITSILHCSMIGHSVLNNWVLNRWRSSSPDIVHHYLQVNSVWVSS